MKIAIDPGHGYANRRPGVYDPGAVAGGVAEADVALALGLTLRWVLRQRGIEAWMSRDDDSDPDPVGTRDDRAEAAGCDAFLSLHCNSADTPSAAGTETYWRDAADKALAVRVQAACVRALGTKDRGLRLESDSQHTRLAVLDFDGPACLLELAFLSNAPDRARLQRILTDRDWRLGLATAIAEAIEAWWRA